MKCIQYCCSTANRSLLVALTYMLPLPSKPGVSANWPPKRICQRQLSHGRRRPTKQDTKLIALSTVSSIRLVFITVKRTSAFVDRGGNYRCVSGSLDRPPAIIIADQNRSYWELPTKAETTGVNYLDGLTGYEREPFDLLYGVFCQQESNDALILYWDLCAIGFTRVEFLYFIYLFIYYYYFFKFFIFLFLFIFLPIGPGAGGLRARCSPAAVKSLWSPVCCGCDAQVSASAFSDRGIVSAWSGRRQQQQQRQSNHRLFSHHTRHLNARRVTAGPQCYHSRIK